MKRKGLIAVLWPLGLGLVFSMLPWEFVSITLIIFVIGLHYQMRFGRELERPRWLFCQLALLIVGLTAARPFVPELGLRGPGGFQREYPGKEVMLAEVIEYGYFESWPGVDPGVVIQLPEQSCSLPTVVNEIGKQTVYTSRVPSMCHSGGPVYRHPARILAEDDVASDEVAHAVCLTHLPVEDRSAFVLYPSSASLHAMLRSNGNARYLQFDLRSLYPDFLARDLTRVPGHPAEFVIWGEHQDGSLRMLRFSVLLSDSDALDTYLVSDQRHADLKGARAACVELEHLDQAWWIQAGTGRLFAYQFSNDSHKSLPVQAVEAELAQVNYLEADWAFFQDLGDAFTLIGLREQASFDYRHFYSAEPTPIVGVRLVGTGLAVEATYYQELESFQ